MQLIMDEQPLELGMQVDITGADNIDYAWLTSAQIIAWGYLTDEILSVMVMLWPPMQIANERNYATFHVNLCDPCGNRFAHSEVYDVRWFANIGQCSDDWRDTRGMDW